ncbi:D-alanyl-D-alanine carboxypeptidase/D-alanyl-D-alanine-endopeptidase [Hugenholtzia roseola]|uniref:D-alanyl-D-alanine carboxypeptidase/D-alanyl-D-alanine-endopeptidase n=1 Tax=Hugenholtzia roseola TaxID=1002 RepID=UPI00041B38D0|nr:D-alanyl-D-alanine carboxypeptidase [Hugenholtzia roseola]
MKIFMLSIKLYFNFKGLLSVFLIAFWGLFLAPFHTNLGQDKADYLSQLDKEMEGDIFANSFHGFVLYDLDSQKYLYEYNADKYFTPASNVKIATLFAALTWLPDSLPAFQYLVKGDSLIFWGTGDPTLLHSRFQNDTLIKFLDLAKDYKLYFSYTNYNDESYGEGWAWEDYRSEDGVEKSPLPIYQNMVELSADGSCAVVCKPTYFVDFLVNKEDIEVKKFAIFRSLQNNDFFYNLSGDIDETVTQTLPFKPTPELIIALLSDTLKREISLIDYPIPAHAKTVYHSLKLPVLERMMQRSDNFLAEQLLLLCAHERFNTLNTEMIIEYTLRKKLRKLSHQPRWVDGSGLSRYNLFTPRSFVEILTQMRKILPNETLLYNLFAVGGKKGTLARRYTKYPPFLYAKTGTLSNNHSVSGYLTTKSGRRWCFSFLNNHHMHSPSKIANQMEKILTQLYLKY